MQAIPVVYRTPIKEQDRDRILRGHVVLYLTVRRRPPQICIVLLPWGWPALFPSEWRVHTVPLYLEPGP